MCGITVGMKFTASQVESISGVGQGTLDYWARTGVAKPAENAGRGRGNGKHYTFTELVGLRAIERLRSQSVSLQAVRRLLPELRRLTDKEGSNLDVLARTRLVILPGRDVAVLTSDAELVSLLTAPGQGVMAPVLLSMGDTVRDVQARMTEAAVSDKQMANAVTELKRGGAWFKDETENRAA